MSSPARSSSAGLKTSANSCERTGAESEIVSEFISHGFDASAASAAHADACAIGRRLRQVVLIPAVESAATLRAALLAARAAVGARALLATPRQAPLQLAQGLGASWWRLPIGADAGSGHDVPPLGAAAEAWRAAALLVDSGCRVVVLAADVALLRDPFAHLSGDVDVEAAQTSRSSGGQVVGTSDPPMGWSAYAQTMTVPTLDDAFVWLSPTPAAAHFAAQHAHELAALPAAGGASFLLTRLVHQPAHDADSRAGVSSRTLRRDCFAAPSQAAATAVAVRLDVGGVAALRAALTATNAPSAAVSAVAAAAKEAEAEAASRARPPALTGEWAGPGSNDILLSRNMSASRAAVLAHGCAARPRRDGAAKARPLNWVLPPSRPFPMESACATDDNLRALCALVKRVANDRREVLAAVLAAVSNKNILQMLGTFVDGLARANISNGLVVSLDDKTAEFVRGRGVPTYVRKLVARGGSTDNHATSGLKFAVIREFVVVGCSVLLSDVDVVWLQNPFTLPSLYRDVDVEGMTDGWDDASAYGYLWRSGDRDQLRLSARNSGLFFVQATAEVLAMMGRLKLRMETQAVWDQTAYNEEMWYATLPGGAPPAVSSRVMSFLCNMNTKVLFRYMLSDAELMAAHRPVSVHVNYHPEKLPRMQDVFERYHGLGPDLGGGLGKPTPRSKDGGLDAWHWGVGLKAGRWCRELKRYRHGERLTQSKLGQRLLREAGNGVSWAGIKSLQFRAGGVVTTPWGSGSWGVTSHGDGAETLYCDFMGQQHIVNDVGKWPELESTRCADMEKVKLVVL